MTLDKLTDECWDDLPVIRKHIAGKPAIKKLLADTLAEFDPGQLEACRSDCDRDGYRRRLLGRVARRNAMDDKDGFVILTFVLMTIAGAIISWLVQRWLDNHFNERAEIEKLRASLT